VLETCVAVYWEAEVFGPLLFEFFLFGGCRQFNVEDVISVPLTTR
jgi:hypothetical protein